MVKAGSIERQKDGTWKIDRAWYGQGMVFKDEYAYKNHPDKPCYVPELSDTVYTANDILALCNGQKDFADELFDGLDWSHPESLMEDWMMNNEWVYCDQCGHLVNYGDGCNDTVCPICGKAVGDEPKTQRPAHASAKKGDKAAKDYVKVADLLDYCRQAEEVAEKCREMATNIPKGEALSPNMIEHVAEADHYFSKVYCDWHFTFPNAIKTVAAKLRADMPEAEPVDWYGIFVDTLKFSEKSVRSDGSEILAMTEKAANAIADLLEALYASQGLEKTGITGCYEKKEDERSGETDGYTGWWYVNLE